MPIITANRDTKLTETPLDSSDPKVGAVFSVPAGQKLAIGFNKISQSINGKAACEFEPHLTIRGQRWTKLYIFLPHWDGVGEVMRSKVATASTFSAAGSNKLLLPITHRDQNDNSANTGQGPGNRQCALTSVVMFLEAMRGPQWLKQQSAGYQQPEDWYATELTRRGFDTTDPQAHARVLRARFGLRVQFRYNLSLADAKDAIERGCGLVSGVRWSSSGHYQFAMGKHLTKGGLYYLDPYGKRGLTDTAALDYYVTIGGKQDPIYWPIPVIKDAWLDLGDNAGWGLWPEEGTYGFYYEKPQVTIAAPQHNSKKITSADIDRMSIEKAVEAMAHPDLTAAEKTQLANACVEEFPKFGLTTRDRVIHFFAQCGHESAGFYYLEELGNNAYFTQNYEGRRDLGNNQAGDGARFKGRGLIQTTGRANYQALSKTVGIDYVANPALLATYPHALTSALVWWDRNRMNELADRGLDDANVKAVSKRVNGGTNGLNDRLNRTDALKLIVRQ